MVKRILKIVAIVLASFVIVAGGAIGIVALTGGFKEKVIEITKLYFDEDPSLTQKTITTLEDIVTRINFEPYDATETDLELTVTGNDNGIIADLPKKIKAGQDFSIKVNKDSKGNNIGGVVTITTKTSIANVSLKVVVDTAIPDNSLYFSGNSSGKITIAGKNFTMPISTDTQYVYLKSNLVNAFYLQANNENMKKAHIDLKYYNEDGVLIPAKSKTFSDGFEAIGIDNPITGKKEYSYKIPVVTDEAGSIQLSAKMHRTYEIEKAFVAGGFDNIVAIMENAGNSNLDADRATLTLSAYNAFLNKYIKYFDNTLESYNFFKQNMNPADGQIILDEEDVKDSLNYVFVSCSANIDVASIRLDDFVADDVGDDSTFKVFSNNSYSISKIVEDFGLQITTDNESGGNATTTEKNYMLENSLNLRPYLYVKALSSGNNDGAEGDGSEPMLLSEGDSSSSPFIGESDFTYDDDNTPLVKWQGRFYKYIPVYGFETDSFKPIIDPNKVTVQEGSSLNISGYLLELEQEDEYFSIKKVMKDGQMQWNIQPNVPMPIDSQNYLFVGFEVSGIDSNNEYITKQAFSRIFVDYKETNDNLAPLVFETDSANLSITTDLAQAPGLVNTINTYGISAVEENSDTQYTSIMYFAEATSNAVKRGSKIATIGKYKFELLDKSASSTPYIQYGEGDLIGERIATYDSTGYYIRALNASAEPVKLFAVTYLSDKDGNPIDIYGRQVVIENEDQLTDSNAPVITVVKITDLDEGRLPEFTVNSYVDNINFYTNGATPSDKYVDENTEKEFTSGLIKRNSFSKYITGTGDELTGDSIKDLQNFLKLKLLYNENFTLYLSNLELGSDASVVESENLATTVLSMKDITGKSKNIEYNIDNDNNKQLAFIHLCQNIDKFTLGYSVSNVEIVENSRKILTSEFVKDASSSYLWDPNNAESIPVAIKYELASTYQPNQSMEESYHFENEGSINLRPVSEADMNIPYSDKLAISSDDSGSVCNNWVSYVINKISIDDISIVDENSETTNSFKMQNKIYAAYDASGNLVFLKTPDPNKQDNDYSVQLYQYGEGKSQYDLWYTFESNMGKGGAMTDGEFGYSVEDELLTTVDYSMTSIINEYLRKNTTQDGVKISYTNAPNVISIAKQEKDAPVRFFNKPDEIGGAGYIYFGYGKNADNEQIDKKFEIYVQNASEYVNINGYVLEVHSSDGQYKYIEIPEGEVFTEVGTNYVLIYNEKFVIYSGTDASNNTYYYITTNGSISNVNVNKEVKLSLEDGSSLDYDATYYLPIKDDKGNAINVVNKDDSGKATINFKQGEVLKGFEKDKNGNYILKNGEYVKANATTAANEQRYSKKGVKTFVIVSFYVTSMQKTIYKAIEYQILQEDIELVGYNADGGENSKQNQYIVEAGQEIVIPFGYTSGKAYVVNNLGYTGFYQKISVTKSASDVGDLNIEKDSNSSYIKITIPSIISGGGYEFSMSYPNPKPRGNKDNDSISKIFYMSISKNATLEWKDSVKTADYTIEKQAGSTIYFETLISFETLESEIFKKWENITSVKFDVVDGGTYCTATESDITLLDSYAEGTAVKLKITITVTTTTDDGTEIYTEIELEEQLTIRIKPTAELTMPKDNSNISIYNGQSIYGSYIKYENSSNIPEGFFEISSKGEGLIINSNDGTIKFATTPSEDKTVNITISYKEANETMTIEHTYELTIYGVDMTSLETADIASNSDNDNVIEVSLKTAEKYTIPTITRTSDSNPDEIFVIAIDNSNESNTGTGEISNASAGEYTYSLWYAIYKDNQYVLIEDTGYDVKLTVTAA